MRRSFLFSFFAILGLISESAAQDLRKAVRDADAGLVKSILESGADVNRTYENGSTSIFVADKLEIVELLLAHGAKLDIRNAATIQSPIENAAADFHRCRDDSQRREWKQIVDRLRKAGAEYTIDTAIYMNDIDFVRTKLEIDDAWVNDRKQAQSVPLKVAAQCGHVEICKLLLVHKADPDAFKECVGFSIMKYAAEHPAVVTLLIGHGANLKRRITWRGGRSGYWIIGDEASILHHVVSGGNPESVKLLLEAGIDPTVTDVDGQTPLHIAVRCERWNRGYADEQTQDQITSSFEQIVKLLIDNDASLAFTNSENQNPLQLAEELDSPQSIVDLLMARRK